MTGNSELIKLPAVVGDELGTARGRSNGRSAKTIHGGSEHRLRQTVIALVDGHSLGEHESPGEATLQVLSGHVKLSWANAEGEPHSWEGVMGDYTEIPDAKHDLAALQDSAILLTVVQNLN